MRLKKLFVNLKISRVFDTRVWTAHVGFKSYGIFHMHPSKRVFYLKTIICNYYIYSFYLKLSRTLSVWTDKFSLMSALA
jgi:hypothetical protein